MYLEITGVSICQSFDAAVGNEVKSAPANPTNHLEACKAAALAGGRAISTPWPIKLEKSPDSPVGSH